MGGLFFFLLWELPSMIVMTTHKIFCDLTDRHWSEPSGAGIWGYRLVGMFTVWPLVMLIILIASGGAGH
jgi:hypothetical protein